MMGPAGASCIQIVASRFHEERCCIKRHSPVKTPIDTVSDKSHPRPISVSLRFAFQGHDAEHQKIGPSHGRRLRPPPLLVGAILAIVAAIILDKMKFAAVEKAPWIGLSVLFPSGSNSTWERPWLCRSQFIADLGQVIGGYVMVGEVIGKQEMTSKRVNGGVFVESVGSVVSSTLGGLPTVTYNQSIGALIVAGIGSRFVFATAGVILVILGLCPKVGAIVASIPAPIVGGLLLVTIAMLCMQSIRVLGSMPETNANLFAAGTGIVVGIGVTALQQEFVAMMPTLFRPFVTSGIVMSFLVAGLLHVVFNLVLKTGTSEVKQTPM
jgi:uric acid transporter